MQPHIREILLNHIPTTTSKAHIEREPKVKRKDCGRFFPYYHFPYFKSVDQSNHLVLINLLYFY